jgi:uncharacterized protein YutE (UPF0331/DUF86 family)
MTPGPLDEKVVAERSEWVRSMLEAIRELPLDREDEFMADRRNVAAAESSVRRALEALLDLGRHVLAKGFGDAPAEYKEVARQLGEREVLTRDESATFVRMAGYRNRLVHFYETVSDRELYTICTERLDDLESILGGIHRWIRAHPEKTREDL